MLMAWTEVELATCAAVNWTHQTLSEGQNEHEDVNTCSIK